MLGIDLALWEIGGVLFLTSRCDLVAFGLICVSLGAVEVSSEFYDVDV